MCNNNLCTLYAGADELKHAMPIMMLIIFGLYIAKFST